MTKLNIDIKDHKFRELLTYWRKIIAEKLRGKQYYEDPRYGTIVLTRREFLKLLLSLGIAGAIATLGIGMFNAHWVWAQETTNPPPTPAQYNYGELNWLELTVRGTPLGEGLVAEYLFLEGTGTTIHDTSGNSNHMQISYHGKGGGHYRWETLPNGKFVLVFKPVYSSKCEWGWNYNGGYYAWGPKFIPGDTPVSITCEAIFYRSSKDSPCFEQVVFGCYDKLRILALGGYSGGKPCLGYFYYYPYKTATHYHLVTYDFDVWHHVIWTSGFYNLDVFLDGQYKVTWNFPSDRTPQQLWDGYAYTHIAHGVGAAQHFFSGKIALIRVWLWVNKDRKLNSLQVQELHKLAKLIIPEIS